MQSMIQIKRLHAEYDKTEQHAVIGMTEHHAGYNTTACTLRQ